MSYQLIGQSKPRGLDEEIKEGIELVGENYQEENESSGGLLDQISGAAKCIFFVNVMLWLIIMVLIFKEL